MKYLKNQIKLSSFLNNNNKMNIETEAKRNYRIDKYQNTEPEVAFSTQAMNHLL